MPKVLLVEDDNNLREIYGARLMAEGFEIISAADGEEALALAVKQKPDLIISDVMMPKISGFDMLDILRTTPETKNTKVIMMTALSQPEDRKRGESLGADKYLVKSQVTLEDVVNAVHEVLNDGAGGAGSAAPQIAQTDQPQATPEPAAAVQPATPVRNATQPSTPPQSAQKKTLADTNPDPASPPAPQPDTNDLAEPAPNTPPPTSAPSNNSPDNDTTATAEEGTPQDPPQAPQVEEPEPTATDSSSRKKKVISPINDLRAEPNVIKLAKEEEQREQALANANNVTTNRTNTAAEESTAEDSTPQPLPKPAPAQEPPANSVDKVDVKPADELVPATETQTPSPDAVGPETTEQEKEEIEEQIKQFVEETDGTGQPPSKEQLEATTEPTDSPNAIAPAPVSAHQAPPKGDTNEIVTTQPSTPENKISTENERGSPTSQQSLNPKTTPKQTSPNSKIADVPHQPPIPQPDAEQASTPTAPPETQPNTKPPADQPPKESEPKSPAPNTQSSGNTTQQGLHTPIPQSAQSSINPEDVAL